MQKGMKKLINRKIIGKLVFAFKNSNRAEIFRSQVNFHLHFFKRQTFGAGRIICGYFGAPRIIHFRAGDNILIKKVMDDALVEADRQYIAFAGVGLV